MQKREPILEYSSTALEQSRERAAEEERRQAIERYNESTFGERRPLASALLQFAVLIAIGGVLAVWLPRSAAQLVMLVLVVGIALWKWRKRGWRSPSWDEFRHPWRR